MTRFLVTGASGLLGLNFCLDHHAEHEILGVTHSNPLNGVPFNVISFNLTDFDALRSLIAEFKPDVLLHCAALADIDACESQPEKARLVNAELPGEVARIANESGFKLVHLSTDSVFDGKQGNYSESDLPNPVTTYSKMKLLSEKLVQENDPNAIIARVVFYGFSLYGKRSLAEFFLNNLRAGREMKGFTDAMTCPLLVNDLGNILLKLAQKDARGVFHVVGSECVSKYEFGVRIAKKFGYNPNLIRPVSQKDGDLKVLRSPNLSMNTNKLADFLNKPVPGLDSGIQKLYDLSQNGWEERIKSFQPVRI